MSQNQEYDALCAQRDNTQRQYNACADRIEDYEYLLNRLRPVKEILTSQKASFKSVRRADEDLLDGITGWEGQQYNDFLTKGEALKGENNYYLNHSLDHVLDSLNDEITRIENLKLNEYGLLGRLGSALNSLGNAIENFFN